MPKFTNTIKLIALTTLAGTISGPAFASGSTKPAPKKMGTKALSTIPSSVPKPVVGEIIVKCAGIAAKGKNHCGANGHPCGGKAATDFDKNEWIYVREGVCNATPGRIVGRKKITKG